MDKVKECAKQHGYETAEYLGIYQNKEAYEAIYSDDNEICFVGLPAIILKSGAELEWIQNNLSRKILRKFY
ncbi:hypothetical protein ACR72Z_01090 [Lactobacillus iners]|uniref:hypothetical protein n=1 Tax=Lactobacillus iners TaxID=147802 RepID=UPI003EB710C4